MEYRVVTKFEFGWDVWYYKLDGKEKVYARPARGKIKFIQFSKENVYYILEDGTQLAESLCYLTQKECQHNCDLTNAFLRGEYK